MDEMDENYNDETKYIRAEFTIPFFRFADGVAFLFDEEKQMIHFYSSYRIGYRNLDMNWR